MRQSIILPLLLLQLCSAEITTRLTIRNCDAAKVTCDALPYRTAYVQSNCYFAVDTKGDSEGTTKQCSLALPGAKLATSVPDAVWSSIYSNKDDFLLAGVASVDKKRGICSFESLSPCSQDPTIVGTPEGTCSALAKKEAPQKFWARFAVWPQVYNPVIVELPEKIEIGQEMIFKGISRPGSNDFIITLQSATPKYVQLQVYILFSQRQVHLKWQGGTDKVVAHQLTTGQEFEVSIRAREDHFKICIDGKDLAEFKYRQALSAITHFEVWNQFGWLSSYKLGKQLKSSPTVTGVAETFAICNRTNPANKCMALVVSGVAKPGFWRSVINVYRKNGDLNLHLNFCYDRPSYITIQANAQFAHHVYISKPFPKPGEFMEVEIVNQESGFDILVNGEEFAFYQHRIPSHDIVGVDISNFFEPSVTFREAKKLKFSARMNLHAGIYSPVIIPLQEKMEPGRELTFKGIAMTGSNEFTINLQSVGAKSIQLQVWILFSQRQVYLNSFFTHIAGKAEILPHSLVLGKPFEIVIRANDDHFKIIIDGKDFAQYKYRQPLDFTTLVEVKGYGFLNSYQLGKQAKPFPTMTEEVETLPICKNAMPKKQCKSLVVTGTVSAEWNRAIINLYRKNGDIGFHLNFMYDKNFAYLDTLHGGRWLGQWTYVQNKPYPRAGDQLEVEIVNGETAFQIFVGGQHFFNYTHKMPSFDIVGVEVSDIREPVITIK